MKLILSPYKNIIPNDIIFYGEIFGWGIQHLHYDRKEPDILFFHSSTKGNYRPVGDLLLDCLEYHLALPCVNFHQIEFKDIEQTRELSELPSEYTKSHHREGIVLISKDRPNVMAKVIGTTYLSGRKKTERH